MKLIPQQNKTQRSSRQRLAGRLAIVVLLLVSGLVSTTGCQLFDRFRSSPQMNSPVVFTEIPTKEQIVTHLINQTQRIEQLQSDVKVSVAGMPALRGTLAIERPDRLRMNAGLLGVSELGIDVGSNEDVFWFWTKIAAGGEQPAIYYAEHDAYQRSALQRVLPIEPSWVIDSLGLMEFDSNDRVEGPFQRPDGLLEIRTYRNKGGQTTTRVTVLDRKHGWVIRQTVYDATGNRLAFADSKSHEYYPDYQVTLPGQVIVTTSNPDGSEMKLTINASRFRINSIYGDPEKLWSMPNPSDVPQINLVEMAERQGVSPTASEGVSTIHRHTAPGQQGIANRSIIQHLR